MTPQTKAALRFLDRVMQRETGKVALAVITADKNTGNLDLYANPAHIKDTQDFMRRLDVAICIAFPRPGGTS